MNKLQLDNSKSPVHALFTCAARLWFSSKRFVGPVCSAGVIAAVTCCGCSDGSVASEPTAVNQNELAEATSAPKTRSGPITLTQLASDLPAAPQESSGLMGQAGKLLSGAKQASGQQVEKTGEWIKGAWGGASDSTGNAVEGSLDWANQTFKTLKDQGLTTASSTGQWLSEDWQSMESWEYKVLATSSVPAEQLEAKLNELGKQGWECFSVDDQRMIFKKASESYLRRLPFKDILRLAPLLNQGK